MNQKEEETVDAKYNGLPYWAWSIDGPCSWTAIKNTEALRYTLIGLRQIQQFMGERLYYYGRPM